MPILEGERKKERKKETITKNRKGGGGGGGGAVTLCQYTSVIPGTFESPACR